MGGTYCGKSCSECSYREKTNCLGCKQGPGKQYSGECKIARCCRNKGHEVCQTCGFRQTCGILSEKNNAPLNRQKEHEAESERKNHIYKQSLVLGKWLWILFWLFVPLGITSVMTNKSLVDSVPGVYIIGCVLRFICSMIYGFILIRLRTEENRYFSAGKYTLICAGYEILILILNNISLLDDIIIFISIPAIILLLNAEYNEYMSHSAVVFAVNDELSYNWENLWKWYIGIICILAVSIILAVIIPLFGVVVLFGAEIGFIIINIMKLIYLYRTARVFRLYSKEILNEDESKSDTIIV